MRQTDVCSLLYQDSISWWELPIANCRDILADIRPRKLKSHASRMAKESLRWRNKGYVVHTHTPSSVYTHRTDRLSLATDSVSDSYSQCSCTLYTRMPGKSYRRRFNSSSYWVHSFWVPRNSRPFFYWFNFHFENNLRLSVWKSLTLLNWTSLVSELKSHGRRSSWLTLFSGTVSS